MFELVPRLVLFALVASASGWRRLIWHTAVAVGLVAIAFGWATEWRFSLVVPAGDANIGAGIVLYHGLSGLVPALVSRVLSLWARRFGHDRPWSLWIEGLGFFAGPVAMHRLLLGA